MGKEWNRINRYADTYYVSSEGHKHAKRRQRNELEQKKLQLFFIFGGLFLTPMVYVLIPKTWVIILGVIMVLLGASSLILFEKRKRNR